ncbi:polysaccharide deacetylase [Porphyromonas gingivalis SJD2]|uniref:Polysaccharide deacetylase family protein n=1 Tax=Porphyromonas gingivalis TaxID=837 RepID=A0AAF0BGR3_PORGN|nr:polysaccharide deacetylase family protein [Porphyromonas gingivalis]ERJ69171.1 polysaccharide deacetylase [Porphyromonas gingivalis F0568]ETA25854.1 polysaccharide deacetylase [Porphyromonas gingivalis SJD2]MCE8188168.1 polysaccharide deacetylase family protein [Porphyromonas gingivalis]MCE8191651.1 polysaccharide deacetylase family protein [Porphyromonas gingivalis]OWR80820.1 polysaccharide deacetylase [Porphyromonas gingivalis SJD5]
MVLLSFDIEEFDVPLEQGYKDFPSEEQLRISRQGTEAILHILRKKGVRSTFFSTVTFWESLPEDLRKGIYTDGHELASHGVFHSSFSKEHLAESRQKLASLWDGTDVCGFRMPRMMPVGDAEIAEAGYLYNSSLNPTCIPGRYNHLSAPRLPYFDKYGVLQMPSSVTPLLRFPLFWLSLHHLPLSLYIRMIRHTVRRDNYLNLYFHPWEFAEISCLPDCKLSYTVTHNSGEKMCRRLEAVIDTLLADGCSFGTFSDYYRFQKQG